MKWILLAACPLLLGDPAGAGPPPPSSERVRQRDEKERKDREIFLGSNDPHYESADQVTRRLDMRDALAETVEKYPHLDPSDPTAQLGSPLSKSVKALFSVVPNPVPGKDPIPISDLGQLLRSQDPVSHLEGNEYVKLTAPYVPKLRDAILASPGGLTPADVMKMSLDACGGNYTLATLTAHNFLKDVAYFGRRAVELTGSPFSLEPGTEYVPRVAERLVNLRGDPSKNDKLGPWYHMYGVLFLGSVTSVTQAEGMLTAEHLTRILKMGSKEDLEKADWDRAAMHVMNRAQRRLQAAPQEIGPDLAGDDAYFEAAVKKVRDEVAAAEREYQARFSAADAELAEVRSAARKQEAELEDIASRLARLSASLKPAVDLCIELKREFFRSDELLDALEAANKEAPVLEGKLNEARALAETCADHASLVRAETLFREAESLSPRVARAYRLLEQKKPDVLALNKAFLPHRPKIAEVEALGKRLRDLEAEISRPATPKAESAGKVTQHRLDKAFLMLGSVRKDLQARLESARKREAGRAGEPAVSAGLAKLEMWIHSLDSMRTTLGALLDEIEDREDGVEGLTFDHPFLSRLRQTHEQYEDLRRDVGCASSLDKIMESFDTELTVARLAIDKLGPAYEAARIDCAARLAAGAGPGPAPSPTSGAVGPPATIVIAPCSTLNVGDGEGLAATVYDASGRVITDPLIAWSSSDTSVATVDSDGMVTATGRGKATVTARSGKAAGSVAVVVEASPGTRTCTIVNAPRTLAAYGTQYTLKAELRDPDGKLMPEVRFQWSASNDAVAVVNPATGTVSTKKPGEVMIWAKPVGEEDYTGWCDITVRVVERPGRPAPRATPTTTATAVRAAATPTVKPARASIPSWLGPRPTPPPVTATPPATSGGTDGGSPDEGGGVSPETLKQQCVDCINTLISGGCYVRVPTLAGWGLCLTCSKDGGVEEQNRHLETNRCPVCSKVTWDLCDFKPAPKGCVVQCCTKQSETPTPPPPRSRTFKTPVYLFHAKPSVPMEPDSSRYFYVLLAAPPQRSGNGYLVPGRVDEACELQGGPCPVEGEYSGPYADEESVCAVLRRARHSGGDDAWGAGAFFRVTAERSSEGLDILCPEQGSEAAPRNAPLAAGAKPSPSPASTAGPTGAAAPPPRIAAQSVQGHVTIQPPVGPPRPLTSSSTVPAGSTVRTGPGSQASLQAGQSTTITVHPGSEIQMPDKRGENITLNRGKVGIVHPPRPPKKETLIPDFDGVESVDGAINPMGTRYEVSLGSDGTMVDVFEGSVRLAGTQVIRLSMRGEEIGKRAPSRSLTLTAGQRGLLMRTAGAGSAEGRGSGAVDPLSRPDPWNDPRVQAAIDEWLRIAIPTTAATKPGHWSFDEWGHLLGPGITITGNPTGVTRHEFMWGKRAKYDSLNACTLAEFIDRRLAGRGLEGCDKGRPLGSVAQATPTGNVPSWLKTQAPTAAPAGVPATATPPPSGGVPSWLSRSTPSRSPSPAPTVRTPGPPTSRSWAYLGDWSCMKRMRFGASEWAPPATLIPASFGGALLAEEGAPPWEPYGTLKIRDEGGHRPAVYTPGRSQATEASSATATSLRFTDPAGPWEASLSLVGPKLVGSLEPIAESGKRPAALYQRARKPLYYDLECVQQSETPIPGAATPVDFSGKWEGQATVTVVRRGTRYDTGWVSGKTIPFGFHIGRSDWGYVLLGSEGERAKSTYVRGNKVGFTLQETGKDGIRQDSRWDLEMNGDRLTGTGRFESADGSVLTWTTTCTRNRASHRTGPSPPAPAPPLRSTLAPQGPRLLETLVVTGDKRGARTSFATQSGRKYRIEASGLVTIRWYFLTADGSHRGKFNHTAYCDPAYGWSDEDPTPLSGLCLRMGDEENLDRLNDFFPGGSLRPYVTQQPPYARTDVYPPYTPTHVYQGEYKGNGKPIWFQHYSTDSTITDTSGSFSIRVYETP